MDIQKRIKEIDYAILMYGLDVWGSSALSNMDKMAKLRKEKENLIKKSKKKWYEFWK